MAVLRLITDRRGIAGMSRVEFLMNLERFKVFPLSAELDDLEKEHAEGYK